MDEIKKQMTEEAIMYEVKNGNLDKASLLYDLYSKPLYNYFAKICFNRDEGYDLMQDTFLRMIRYRNSFDKEKSFRAWIYQIARNVFADHLKKNKRMTSDSITISQESIVESDNTEQEYKTGLLNKALEKLAEDEREILVLSRYRDMKYQDIALITGNTVSNVKVKSHRAIKKLRDYYFKLEKTGY